MREREREITQPTENWEKHYAMEGIIISSSQLNKKSEQYTPFSEEPLQQQYLMV